MRVGDEGRRIEIVGLDVLVLEPVGEPHPGPESVDRAGADESGIGLRQVLPLVEADARMRHEDLRVLLEVGGDRDGRNVVLHREEIADHVAAHEELDLAGDEQHAAVRHRAALHDRDVEAVFGVGPVDERLIIAAGLGVGDPIGAEGHLVGGEGRRRESNRPRQRRDHRNAHDVFLPPSSFIGRPIERATFRGGQHTGRNSKRRIHF